MKAVREDDIRGRAYEIWEANGRPEGLEQEHWFIAEQQLLDAAPEIVEARTSVVSAVAANDAMDNPAETSVAPDADAAVVQPDDWAETRLEAEQFR